MGFQDLLLLTALNTAVCLCLPKMVSIFESIKTRQSQKLSVKPTVQVQPELAQSDVYPEFASLAR
jgi:hypothetical protein